MIRAIGRLESRGVLAPSRAAFFTRVARRDLVSVRLELRALLTAAVLAWGLRSRRRTILGAGVLMAALSLATLRHYVHVAPAWLVLVGAGCLLIAGSVALERRLRAGANRQRFGFTAEALFENEARQQAVGVVAAAAAFSPEAPPRPGDTGSHFTDGGGDSGGGGAGESY